jgi:hypothetical protein
MLKHFSVSALYLGKPGSVLPSFVEFLHSKGINTTIKETSFEFNNQLKLAPRNCRLIGYWQSPKYFQKHKKKLLIEFSPKKPIALSSKITSLLKNYPTTSIHVRKGDYVSNPQATSLLGCLPISYYQAALEIINKIDKNMKYIIISDDINWCKKNFNKITDPNVVTYTFVGEVEDMEIMKRTSHNIVANSSYSWWGAYLNQNPNKTIVVPKQWFQPGTLSSKDLIPNSWIKV